MTDAFDIFMSQEPLRLRPAPRNIGDVATVALNHMKGAIVEGKVHNLVVLTFKADTMTTWILRGKLPAPVDEIVRNVAAETGCDALAFVAEIPPPPNVVGDRVFNIAVEGKEGVVETLIALRGEHPDPSATAQIYGSQLRPTHKWLGVPSTWKIQMFRKDAGFKAPPTGEA